MVDVDIIRAYTRVIQAYRRLQMSVTELVQASGVKHQEIWTYLGFKKDTFYRRLRLQDWSSRELQVVIPFLIKKTQAHNPELHEQLKNKVPGENHLP
jgi:hypothetical protein